MSESLQYFSKKIISFWKSAAWSLFMLILFLLPSDNISKAPSIPYLAEAAHFILFSIFSWLLYHDFLKHRTKKVSFGKSCLFVLLGGLIFGILIEIIQEISGLGRKAEIGDIMVDLIGIISAIGVLWFLSRRKQNTVSKD
jgi:VanZ family protein